MNNTDFWITLAVMLIVLIVVTSIKCIPKNKLPYCLGGTKEAEKFTCPAKYIEWCNSNDLDPILSQNELYDMSKKEACDKTIQHAIRRGDKPKGYKPKYRW